MALTAFFRCTCGAPLRCAMCEECGSFHDEPELGYGPLAALGLVGSAVEELAVSLNHLGPALRRLRPDGRRRPRPAATKAYEVQGKKAPSLQRLQEWLLTEAPLSAQVWMEMHEAGSTPAASPTMAARWARLDEEDTGFRASNPRTAI